MRTEVYVHDLLRSTKADPDVLVRDESPAFLAGETPWEAEAPPDWRPPAVIFALSLIVLVVSVIGLGNVAGLGWTLAASLVGVAMAGPVTLGRWFIRSSPALPVELISGTVAKLGLPTRVGTQTIFVEFRSPDSELNDRASFKTTVSEAARLGIGPGTVMYVLYFDENRTVVL